MSDFKVTRYRIRSEEGQPHPDSPFSAVFVSDLHNASYGEENVRLLQEIRNENPEMILVTGDMLISSKEPRMDAALSFMDELTKKYPVYYVNGNHELRMKENPELYGNSYEKYITEIRSYGVHVLENSKEAVTIHNMPVTIRGLDLPLEYYRRMHFPELTAEKIEELTGPPVSDSYQILLTHNPCFFDAYADWGADLTLAGHLHGGIIRLPLLGGVLSPQMGLFPKYDKGLFTKNGKKMIVSAGLGNHSINLRINNPPEVIVIDFR